jgi:hypothetical protein
VNPISQEGVQEPPELLPVPDDPVPVDDPPEDPLDVVPSVEASEGVVETPPPQRSEKNARPRPARTT